MNPMLLHTSHFLREGSGVWDAILPRRERNDCSLNPAREGGPEAFNFRALIFGRYGNASLATLRPSLKGQVRNPNPYVIQGFGSGCDARHDPRNRTGKSG